MKSHVPPSCSAAPSHTQFGLIYSFCENNDYPLDLDWIENPRKAFFSSCKAVRTAPSVLAQISTLFISQEQLHQHSSGTVQGNPILCLPRGATLRCVLESCIVCGQTAIDHLRQSVHFCCPLSCHPAQSDASCIQSYLHRQDTQ